MIESPEMMEKTQGGLLTNNALYQPHAASHVKPPSPLKQLEHVVSSLTKRSVCFFFHLDSIIQELCVSALDDDIIKCSSKPVT